MITYKFGDVVLIEFPHTDFQGSSKRPALIIYDAGDDDVLVARITTQKYTTETDYKILNWKNCGLLSESYLRLSKQATIEKQYIRKQLGSLQSQEIKTIKSVIKRMLVI